VETFAGRTALLQRWGRCLEARVAALPQSVSSAPRIRPAAIIALISYHHQLRALYPGAAAEWWRLQHLEL